jgi:hypothetical protein
MNGYEPSTPRAASGLIAIAMTAITVGALVVLPAKLESARVDPYMPAVAKGGNEGTVEVAISPARGEVTAEVGREGHDQPGRAALGSQSVRGKGGRPSSRRRASTWPARLNLQYSGSRD